MRMRAVQIQGQWNRDLERMQNRYAKTVTLRVKALAKRLKNFKLTKILFGNGTWCADCEPFTVVDEDGDSLTEECYREIFAWSFGRRTWTTPCFGMSLEVKALREIHDLCDWCSLNDIVPNDIVLG